MARLRYVSNARTGVAGTVSTKFFGVGSTTPVTLTTTSPNALHIQGDQASVALRASYAIKARIRLTGDGASSAHAYAVNGWTEYSGTGTTNAVNNQVVGVAGLVKNSGTIYNTGIFLAGMLAQVLQGGTYTKANHICSLWADNQLRSAAGDVTNHELIYMTNNNSGSGSRVIGQAMFLYGPYVTNFVHFWGCETGGMVSNASASALHGTLSKKIKISINDVTYYLLASTTPT